MAAPIIENWTDLEGLVQSVSPAADVAQHVVVEIRVRRAQAVKGFANLLADAAGTVVRVHVANESAKQAGLTAGAQVRCRVRRGGPHRIFAHPTEIHVG